MKKTGIIVAVVLFVVGATFSGFFGLWGESWYHKLFDKKTEPAIEETGGEQVSEIVQCEYCGLKIPKEQIAFHEQTCVKKP